MLNKYKQNEHDSHDLSINNYITRLKKIFGYEYEFGNPFIQYKLLLESSFYNDNYILLIKSVNQGELALTIEALKRGADIHSDNDYPLRWASYKGYLEIVKYLIKKRG